MLRSEANALFGVDTSEMFLYRLSGSDPLIPPGSTVLKVSKNGVSFLLSSGMASGATQEEIVDDTPEQIEAMIAAQIEKISSDYDNEIKLLANDTPVHERESWYKQELEARAFNANPSVSTPYIDGLAAARGVDKLELISRILTKVSLYEQAHSALTGKRQRLEDQLRALPNDALPEDIYNITW